MLPEYDLKGKQGTSTLILIWKWDPWAPEKLGNESIGAIVIASGDLGGLTSSVANWTLRPACTFWWSPALLAYKNSTSHISP